MPDSDEHEERKRQQEGQGAAQPEPMLFLSQFFNRWLRVGEDLVYILAGVLLVGAALLVLVNAGVSLVTAKGDTVKSIVESTLDSLLIGFILVELLGAARETMSVRKLVAEPFLLVGIIAAIKQMLLVSSFRGKRSVEDAMFEIGVLGAVVIGLAIASYVLRRREREPGEEEVAEPEHEQSK